MKRTAFLLVLLLVPVGAQALFRYPAVSRTQIAFVHDGQVWVAPRSGGDAVRVTDTPGFKFDVRFSPDGQRLAFSAREGPDGVNLYTTSTRGGAATRITWLPSHQMLTQWTRDDRLLFATTAQSFRTIETQLLTVSSRGGLPVKLPLTYGSDGALDDSGEWLAYTPQWPNPLIAQWKRYRGGAAPDIWLANIRTGASEKITSWIGSDLRPMWHGTTLYYVSDDGAEKRLNLWSYESKTRVRKQVTHLRDYDVRNASVGADAIVFEYGPTIQMLDLRRGTVAAVRINVPAKPTLQKEVDASSFVTNRQVAMGRVVYEARGDLWLAELGGAPRNLTSTSGAFEREAALSPDGSRIAYSSDATGEYQLYVRDVASGKADALTSFASGFRYRPLWSPDGKKLLFTDQRAAIHLLDLASGRVLEVDQDPLAEVPEMAWSPDSTWIAYTRSGDNRLTSIWRYEIASGQRQQLATDAFNGGTPAFDPSGAHFFFISYRNFSTPSMDWLSQRFTHRGTGVIMAVPLHGLRFELSEVERRALRLVTAGGAITALAATHDGNALFSLTDGAGASTVRLYHLDTKKEEVLLTGDSDFTISSDGRQLLISRDDKPVLRDLVAATETPLDTTMRTTVDLRAEWREMFEDVLRRYRDFFYAPKHGPFDWQAVGRMYRPMLEQCVTREEVNSVFAQVIGESSVGHAYIDRGGDVPQLPAASIGLLGVDFALENGAYRIVRIYQGAPWDDAYRSPLQGRVATGEYLLAVNGTPVDVRHDPRAAFFNLADKPVTIRVGPHPAADAEAREVIVTPVGSEGALRYRDWLEANRVRVDKASSGRIGYLHMPDFSTSGLNEFARQYYGQITKESLIIDTRWSQGGSVGAHVAEMLARQTLNFLAARETPKSVPIPRWGAHVGRKALLVNHITMSAGENFAYYFRKLGLGPLIGSRTWGGLTGLNPVPNLLDGGYVNVPNAPFFDGDQEWIIEGHGLDPDIPVEYDPAAKGDPQLDAAIAALLK
jgi:tricorn protease